MIGGPNPFRGWDPVCAHFDPELWHPISAKAEAAEEAKELCRLCQHLTACREYALADPRLTGVWGATTEVERGRIRRRTARQAAKAAAS